MSRLGKQNFALIGWGRHQVVPGIGKKQLSTYVDMEPFISVRQLGLGACAVFQFDLTLLLAVLQRQLLVS